MVPGKELVTFGTATFVHVRVKSDYKFSDKIPLTGVPHSIRFVVLCHTRIFCQCTEIANTTNGFVIRPKDIHVSHFYFHGPLVVAFAVSQTTFAFKDSNSPGKRISERQPNCVLAWLRQRLVRGDCSVLRLVVLIREGTMKDTLHV